MEGAARKGAAAGGSVRVGLIADTHGLLRPEALDALAGSDLIVHAGDVGDPAVLGRLRALAPVHAVRGNVDRGALARSLPAVLTLDVAGRRLHVVHAREDYAEPAGGPPAAVVFGHSHRPSVETRDGVLWVNPGSAGPRRFRLPVSVAILCAGSRTMTARIVLLPG